MILALYKPKGPTSHDMIDKVRRATGEKKVGHAGTLDPLASGVLVVAVGREDTKKLSEEEAKEKEYIAVVQLGQTSTTDDEEGEKAEIKLDEIPHYSDIEAAIREFEGMVQQTPPVYSSVKIQGRPAHRRVRKGEEIVMKSRTVQIKEIEILNYAWPMLEIRVITGPGVYIRALARDIGKRLGTGGYLRELERTRVGEYTTDDSLNIEEVEKHYANKK